MELLIRDIVDICERELGSRATLELLSKAALGSITETVPTMLDTPLARRQDFEHFACHEAVFEMWGQMWAGLGRRRPELFNHPTKGREATAIAYLYTAHNNPESLSEFRPTRAEQALIGPGRDFLISVGLEDLREPCLLSCYGQKATALRGLREFGGWIGFSLSSGDFDLARVIMLDQRYLRGERKKPNGAREIAALVLHEETHAGLVLAAGRSPEMVPLGRSLNEAVTSFLEIAAITVASGSTSPWKMIDELTGLHGYRKPIRALRSIMPKRLSVEAAATLAAKAEIKALRGEGEKGVLAALRELSGQRRSYEEWLKLFGTV